MRVPVAVLVVVLGAGCAHSSRPVSPVLAGTVGSDPADGSCPWTEIEKASLERDGVIVNGVYYGVGGTGSGFEHLLAGCGLAHAIRPFRAWRSTVTYSVSSGKKRETADVIKTYAVLVAVSAAASALGQPPSPEDELSMLPAARPPKPADPANGVEIDAARAFLDALVGPAD